MPSLSRLKNDAEAAKSKSSDDAVRKLAETVAQLVKKVRNLEAEVASLRSRL